MDERGFSLMEVLIASVLAAVVAAGTLASFVASARITGNYNASTMAEAGGISMQIVEKFRDNVAADDTTFSTSAGGGWQTWTPASTATSGLSITNRGANAKYRVDPVANCDGAGGTCYKVTVQTCWDGTC